MCRIADGGIGGYGGAGRVDRGRLQRRGSEIENPKSKIVHGTTLPV